MNVWKTFFLRLKCMEDLWMTQLTQNSPRASSSIVIIECKTVVEKSQKIWPWICSQIKEHVLVSHLELVPSKYQIYLQKGSWIVRFMLSWKKATNIGTMRPLPNFPELFQSLVLISISLFSKYVEFPFICVFTTMFYFPLQRKFQNKPTLSANN